MSRSVLFHRDFKGLTGGHLKVRDYFDHLKSSDLYTPKMYVTPMSRSDHLWRSEKLAAEYKPEEADVLFVAGLDWAALARWGNIEEHIPVVNLIQHVRHAVAGDPRHEFLCRRAVRICVSEEVSQSLRQTGMCNGPIYTSPCGLPDLAAPQRKPVVISSDVCIAGVKRPNIARKLARHLRRWGLHVDCPDLRGQIDRETYLKHMAGARIVVTLPNDSEGFYLPALEAMKLGKAVICPDAVGNRGFCIDRVTALMPQPSPQALADSVMELLSSPGLEQKLLKSAEKVAAEYTLQRERDALLQIMETVK